MGLFSKLFSRNDTSNGNQIYAPVAGQAVAITEVPDPVFSGKMMGDGVAIIPSDGKIYAPFGGTVDMMFDTGHAVGLISDTGVEVLIHVGLETVSLHGKPFKVRVKKGDKVKRGQLLLEADLKTIKSAGLNTITPVIVCNFGDYSAFNTIVDKNVTTDDLVIEVEK